MNLMGVFGLGAAVELLLEASIEDIEQHVLDLGDEIIEEADKRRVRNSDAEGAPRTRRQRNV